MDFLEKDLETILYESDKDVIRERGLTMFHHTYLFRQVNLGTYGIADLISLRKSGKEIIVKIYELKNKVLNPSAFWQTVKYVKAVRHIINQANNQNHKFTVMGIMVGRTIDMDSDFCFLPTIHSGIHIYTYDYKINGISFEYIDDIFIKTNFKRFDTKQLYCEGDIDFYKTYLGIYSEPELAINFIDNE